MDTLTLKTQAAVEGAFAVSWQWRQSGARQPIAGVVAVKVPAMYEQDKAVIAELRAIYYLLEDRKIHGDNRLGNGIRIEVSAGAIRKAMLKGALKTTGAGKTQKEHIAAGVAYLATKYFEAQIDVGRWKEMEPKSFEQVEIELEPVFPTLRLPCPLVNESVLITRHAMARYIARIDLGKNRHEENDLGEIPDSRWSAAWRWFERVLVNKNIELASVRPESEGRLKAKYGPSTIYIRFPDAQAILVVQSRPSGLVIPTVLQENQYSGFLEKTPYIVGQSIVRGHHHERNKANRTD